MKYDIPSEAEERLPDPGTRSGRLSRWFLQRYPVWRTWEHLEAKVVPTLIIYTFFMRFLCVHLFY